MKGQGRLSKYCRIFQWVEAQDPEFARAIHDLCLEGALSPGGRVAGVTLLYPDKAFRAEIVAKADSNPDEAVKLIESLIIPDVFLQQSEFGRRAVGNRCGVAFTVGAEGKGDVEVAPVADFSTLASKAGTLAVWRIVRGRPPTSGAAYAPPAGAARPRPIRGGAPAGRGERACLACLVEQEYCAAARGGGAMRNPYLARVVSLLNFLRVKAPELLAAVRPVLDYDPVVTFYLLVEPYKTRGAYLIPDELLVGEGGWRGADAYSDAVADYESFFQGNNGDRAATAARVDAVRSAILGDPNVRNALAAVLDAYRQLAEANTIGGNGPVLPPAAAAALGGGKKQWQDEFRFIIHEALQAMRAAPFSEQTFCNIVRDIATVWPGNDYTAELRLASTAALQGNVAPRAEYLMLLRFVNSTDFLYLPVAPDAVGGAWGSMDPTEPGVYNRNAVALENLRRTAPMVHADGISDRALQEIKIYAGLHGGALPPALAALSRA